MKIMQNLQKGGELCQKSQLETASAILDENLKFTRYNELIKKIERKGGERKWIRPQVETKVDRTVQTVILTSRWLYSRCVTLSFTTDTSTSVALTPLSPPQDHPDTLQCFSTIVFFNRATSTRVLPIQKGLDARAGQARAEPHWP